jgi:hypothetical protein
LRCLAPEAGFDSGGVGGDVANLDPVEQVRPVTGETAEGTLRTITLG